MSRWDVAWGPRDWETPSVIHRNKCRAHVPLWAHPSPDAAMRHFLARSDETDNPHRISLNSADWTFKLFDRPEAVPKGFSLTDFDDAQWGKVGSSCFLRGMDDVVCTCQ